MPRFPALVTFATGREFCERVATMSSEWDIMLDSGAFTNWSTGKIAVTMEAYLEFLADYAEAFPWYLNLDVIGDAEATRANYQRMKREGFSPVPVFQRGAPADELRRMVQDRGFVCIGGVSRNPTASSEMDYMRQCLSIVDEEGGEAHLLGVAGITSLKRLRPKSADASTWSSASRYGELRLWTPRGWENFKKHKNTNKKTDIRPRLARTRILQAYGLRWADLYDEDQWHHNRDGKVVLAAARSWIRYVRTLLRAGIRLHTATHSTYSSHRSIVDAWEAEKNSWT